MTDATQDHFRLIPFENQSGGEVSGFPNNAQIGVGEANRAFGRHKGFGKDINGFGERCQMGINTYFRDKKYRGETIGTDYKLGLELSGNMSKRTYRIKEAL